MFSKSIVRNMVLIGVISVILFYIPLFFLSTDVMIQVTHEDAFYESITALFFFLASMVLLYKFIKAKNRSIFFLLFALAFFFAAGEEISWGQRILHFATPAAVKAINAQGEFNFHNLTAIQHEHGLSASIKALLNFNRLFIVFYVVYTILVPLANRYSSFFKSLFARIRLPIVSLWFGAIFVLNEITCKMLQLLVVARLPQNIPIEEIKEALWGLTILLMSIYFFYEYQTQFAFKRREGVEMASSSLKG